MENLNPQQVEAVETIEGPLLVLAGAGSGKTRVITYRIAHLINRAGVRPDQVLAVTFTNKAAEEMKSRVEKMLDSSLRVSSPLISTFHSLCVRILRRDIERMNAGYTRNFTIYDEDDQARVVRQILKELDVDDKSLTARQGLSAISWAKNRSITPAAYANQTEYVSDRTEKIAQIYKLYEQRLQQSNALDFDDLLIRAVALLRQVEEVRVYYHERFRHVMIDEFQDTNGIQYELARLIAVGSKTVERGQIDKETFWNNRSLCVVGDVDQCVPGDSLVLTVNGHKPIKEIRRGEEIIAAGGHSRRLVARVGRVKSKHYRGKVVEIKTALGKQILVTPNHILFGRLNPLPGKYIVYLMYRQDKGFRIGRSLGERSLSRQRRNQLGLLVRSNQEHADKMWVLRVCDSKSEAAFYETLYSTRYGIPTIVFHISGREGMSFAQSQIDSLYEQIDTRKRAQQLFEDLNLFGAYPHLKPKTRYVMGRFNVNLVMFGDSRTSTLCPWGGHRIQFATSEQRLRPFFEEAGLSCRSGKRFTWRHETARVSYDEACAVTDKIQNLDSRIEIVRKAMLVSGAGSYQEFPASHFHPGMSIAVHHEGKIAEDIITSIEFTDYSGEVYDLDVADVHNFICQDVVCHNSVYSWRGSDFNIILGFQHDFEGTKIIKLEQNYRSTQRILEAANRVIERNRQRLPKTLYATEELGEGDKIRYYQSYDGEGEASFVAEKIGEHLRRSPDVRSAVLYRTNAQSRLFEESLRRRGIAYNIVGGFSFYERAEVKDIIAYLKLALNPHDDIALIRIINSPPRGIGKTTIDSLTRQQRDLDVSLWETIAVAIDQRTIAPRATSALDVFRQVIISLSERVVAGQPISDIVKAATLETGYVRALEEEKSEEAEGRLLNIEELVSAAVEAEEQNESLRDFIDHAALASDTDQYKADARVTLMTMHAAKGLEFPVVFIAGMEEGLFPHSRAAGSEEDLEEERRLCYVAITRAQRHLYITHAMRRRTFGEEHPAEPSRFLNEIPLELLENMSAGPSWLGFAARPETRHNREALSALKGETPQPYKKRSNFSGKTYNSVESVRDFFNRQAGSKPEPQASRASEPQSQAVELRVGSRVRHARYGAGVVLRVEGSGPEAKLTVSFPGFGQKKFVARYAALEKA